ncbi:uncharacterized protein EV420DRAFT_1767900 [Desarmillaria tabescens]|uniref:Ricin B lectin domain-containing protein n=1 Tax=Armillaria tabescens TaxID=1929756 RepID=A0AA39JNQ6_ARMTA|nr:uncharacterized protein EV420DRAFT_1767900 [Desarmillaria tabescens]KAK0446003.1 hypothetical protein EV420DRAFT_1767900 [Desarmillaria tabescens]
MVSDKLLVLSSLFLVAFAQLPPEITSGEQRVLFENEHSQSSVRSYTPDRDIYVPFVNVEGGEHEQWTLSKTQGGYTIGNVATGGFIKAEDKRLVTTTSEGNATTFAISPAGGDSYVIKLPYEDLVWTVQNPVNYQGAVILAPSVGSDAQLWYIDEADESCDVD